MVHRSAPAGEQAARTVLDALPTALLFALGPLLSATLINKMSPGHLAVARRDGEQGHEGNRYR